MRAPPLPQPWGALACPRCCGCRQLSRQPNGHTRARACRRVQGLTYAAFACFGIEYITLFLGVTIFHRLTNLLNILAHGAGLILMILFQVDVSAACRLVGDG